MPNIIEGIQEEMNRCRELLSQYKLSAKYGSFGTSIIRTAIKRGEKAIANGDVIEMIIVYKQLRELE